MALLSSGEVVFCDVVVVVWVWLYSRCVLEDVLSSKGMVNTLGSDRVFLSCVECSMVVKQPPWILTQCVAGWMRRPEYSGNVPPAV